MWKRRATDYGVWIANRLPVEIRTALQDRDAVQHLQERVGNLERHAFLYNTLFYKAFSVAGLGDYLEFGVFTGGTLCGAFRSAQEFYRQVAVDRVWGDSDEKVEQAQRIWAATRFVGFDSFRGLPASEGPDAGRPVFDEGQYSASTAQVWANIDRWDVDQSKVELVEGFFADTCNQATVERLALGDVAVVHIDSDLYESAAMALNFCTPHFRDGSVVIFDEWFQFSGRSDHGEQRAFGEWRQKHPEWRTAELAREGAGRMAFVLTRA